MKPYLIDVPVAIFFFARPEQTKQVFEPIKHARPSKLFLIQDGARKGRQNDVENVYACRKIFEDIDWDCQVFKNYSEENLGCGKRTATGMKWIFEHVDRIIRIEDDAVPSLSFFPFCAELLEKYKHDERISTIAGVNQLSTYENGGYDYFFSTGGSVAAFATWKRVWDYYDYDFSFMESNYYSSLVKKNLYPAFTAKRKMKSIARMVELKKKNAKLTSWSAPMGVNLFLYSQVNIVPRVNMITNIGVVNGATNGDGTLLAMPKSLQSIFFAPRYELEFPINHPLYIINDKVYVDKVQKIMNGGSSPIGRLFFLTENAIRKFIVRYLKRK